MYDMANLKKMKTLKELAPEAMAAFSRFDAAAMKDGAIPTKYKELMALAVALTTQCPYCIEIHAKAAKRRVYGGGNRRGGTRRRGLASRRRRSPTPLTRLV